MILILGPCEALRMILILSLRRSALRMILILAAPPIANDSQLQERVPVERPGRG